MNKSRAQTFVFWLLPILVLRALMPLGTMLEARNGTPTMVMCSEGFSKAAKQSGNSSSSHEQVTQHGDQHSVCPFAIALAVAPPVENTFYIKLFITLAVLDSETASYRTAPGPSRIILTRGPPTHA